MHSSLWNFITKLLVNVKLSFMAFAEVTAIGPKLEKIIEKKLVLIVKLQKAQSDILFDSSFFSCF